MNKTKNSIFLSAVKVFSSNGYEGATMDEIAISAGVAKGTLYYHFRSKEEIFKYIISEGMKLVQDEISAVSNNSDTALGRLKSVFKVQIMIVHRNKDFFKVIASQIWGKELRQFELRNKIESYINDMEGLIDDAIKSNQIKKGNSRLMAYSFIGSICSSSIYEISNSDGDMDNSVESMMEYILNGIGI
ncbi:TetR/AcrR family transcriptional regulator [Clostridium estertheticum]|uniref:TetR/AcrR family transcriptional regulator n=1 Tax=Clostridium estertheticum TaxID=238834 RepID=UPI001C7DBF0D|nr:TetR/AcrR family transcriptional regulator [Clostridium estertheticum]MBX4258442.1 TetR/AcrR family transcriptional regulator [Clostridium estertheticum]WLC69606.1 TetR/AcrR family transcriptional regulator [Clostridium estertheticum]